jgi:hypothetical protein
MTRGRVHAKATELLDTVANPTANFAVLPCGQHRHFATFCYTLKYQRRKKLL